MEVLQNSLKFRVLYGSLTKQLTEVRAGIKCCARTRTRPQVFYKVSGVGYRVLSRYYPIFRVFTLLQGRVRDVEPVSRVLWRGHT